ncbi:hypothetical protein [Mycobacterium sp.]|uniref:hypothetical protein n=1 Tax=Mycobacterium sp. TaxID=1785 RepID=UPI002B9639B0|nr:hypothetical protein [Mycobacterium sp.]HME49809.1 hypothetical protein [Mycobacterium sp.]
MAASVTMMIPAVLRYDLRATDSGWQISRLRAYWELPAMIAQFLARGARSLPASMQLSSALLRNQRLGGTAGFLAAVRGPRRRGKRLVQDMLRASGAGKGVAGRGKVIGAGQFVAASVTTPTGPGVLFAEIGRDGRRITRHRLFANT